MSSFDLKVLATRHRQPVDDQEAVQEANSPNRKIGAEKLAFCFGNNQTGVWAHDVALFLNHFRSLPSMQCF